MLHKENSANRCNQAFDYLNCIVQYVVKLLVFVIRAKMFVFLVQQ